MTKISAVIPDALGDALRAKADGRPLSAVIRRALANYLEDVRPVGGWTLEETWGGVFAVRDKPGCPGTIERVRVDDDGPAAWETRPVASMELRE